MEAPSRGAQPLSRPALIATLREELSRRAGDDMSICMLAARTSIFCRGFRRYSREELEERFGWLARKIPGASREELEQLADRWQLARQEALGAFTSCDVQQAQHDTCRGWDDFSKEDLARFLDEIRGRVDLRVTD